MRAVLGCREQRQECSGNGGGTVRARELDASDSMKNVDWPKDEVSKVAGGPGRPLEVACAQAFIGAEWTVDLGSYFADGDRIREFDVLASRVVMMEHGSKNARICVRALVSCKGCKPTCSPLAYSVSESNIPPCRPRVRSLWRFGGWRRRDDLEQDAGAVLIKCSELTNARPLIAFDVVEREETSKQGRATTVTFKSVGDKIVYEG